MSFFESIGQFIIDTCYIFKRATVDALKIGYKLFYIVLYPTPAPTPTKQPITPPSPVKAQIYWDQELGKKPLEKEYVFLDQEDLLKRIGVIKANTTPQPAKYHRYTYTELRDLLDKGLDPRKGRK